jgi:hypothetical protein
MMGEGERMLVVVQVELEYLRHASQGDLQTGKATLSDLDVHTVSKDFGLSPSLSPRWEDSCRVKHLDKSRVCVPEMSSTTPA